jgi:cytochrome P450
MHENTGVQVLQEKPAAARQIAAPLLDAAFAADPYPAYRRLRAAGPLQWSDEFFGGAWLLHRHADVEAVLRDSRFSAMRTGGWVMQDDSARAELSGFQRLFSRALLFLDAPDHGRVRQVLNPAFRPAAMAALHGFIEQRVAERLDAVDAGRGFDFMQVLARPLPAEVIARLMGVDASRQDDFIRWSDDLAAFIGAPMPTRELARRAQVSLLGMSAYFEVLQAERRQRPGDDLVSRLLQGEAEGQIGSGAEMLAQCAMLLFAGHETTRNLLGNGLHALLRHRTEWQQLQQAPQRVGAAVRELLRYDSPVQYTGRRVATDLTLHGQRLRRGDLVVALIGAANRDPARHAEPERLDVHRAQPGTLAFGSGPHVCIGTGLTLMEAEIVFRQLLQRWPGLRLAGAAAEWSGNPVYRGLQALHVHT